MKIAFAFLVLLPLTLSAPTTTQKPLNPFVLALMHIFHVDHMKALVTDLVDELGSDQSEGACEKDCDLVVTSQVHSLSLGTIGHSACPLVCHSFQELVHFFHLTPPASTLAPGQVPT